MQRESKRNTAEIQVTRGNKGSNLYCNPYYVVLSNFITELHNFWADLLFVVSHVLFWVWWT